MLQHFELFDYSHTLLEKVFPAHALDRGLDEGEAELGPKWQAESMWCINRIKAC